MQVYELSEQEIARNGYTHKAVISYANGDFTAAATTQTYTLFSAPAATVVSDFAYRAVTLLSGGAVSACTLQAGKTGTTNGYITATSVFTAGTTAKAGDGTLFNQAAGDGLAAAIDIVAVITTTTANVVALTAGEIHIFFAVKLLATI